MSTVNGESKVSDLHIASTVRLPSPAEMRNNLPLSEGAAHFVSQSRHTLHQIIFGDDPRLLAVVGPCSIHDTGSALEYAEKLRDLAEEVKEHIYVVMRVYFEKPRTTVGWKGLIMDPQLDGSCDIPSGLKVARTFLQQILDLELPTATEFLDPITPQYIADLLSWAAIGARTTESQTHRQMASGLSMPLGFKNTTAGEVQPAINAICAARQRQTFLGINPDGEAAAVTTTGNEACHLILRGGSNGPNFDPDSVRRAKEALLKAKVPTAILVDCSHANSGKDPERQPEVLDAVVDQLTAGEKSLIGVMLESHLQAGTQPFPVARGKLKRGVSITDGCIDFATTRHCLLRTAARLSKAREAAKPQG